LTSRGSAVTFASVAAEAHVSESFLYKHQELADRIRTGRRPAGQSKARSRQEAASAASLRVQVHVLIERLEAADLKIKALTAENEALRGEVSDLRARQGGRGLPAQLARTMSRTGDGTNAS
jgi:hypothetical protein